MLQVVYTILYALGFVLLSPVFVYKMWKRGKYRENFTQRFGRYAPALHQQLDGKTAPRGWIQAVSVGEMNLALVVVAALRQRFPQHQLVVTTTTSTGYAFGRERLPAEVVLLYFPQDFPGSVRRAYNLIQPDFIVLMESEVWPNHVWEGARRNAGLAWAGAGLAAIGFVGVARWVSYPFVPARSNPTCRFGSIPGVYCRAWRHGRHSGVSRRPLQLLPAQLRDQRRRRRQRDRPGREKQCGHHLEHLPQLNSH